MDTTPFWMTTVEVSRFPQLSRDLEVDVLIVGGGICGVTAAHLLARAGQRVALIEKERIGSGMTGHTTAHVTYVMDWLLTELTQSFGRDHAQAAWDAGSFAMMQIEETVREEGIDCELRKVPGYLCAALDGDPAKEAESLRDEALLAAELGFDATFVEAAPVFNRPGVRFANQLKFHPMKYLTALAQRAEAAGALLFEGTPAGEFSSSPLGVKANGFTIRCERMILATHVPLQGAHNVPSAALLQTKLAAYSTYAIGARIPVGALPEALFWDTADPYRYLRVERRDGHDYAIYGGADHKTGQEENTDTCFFGLGDELRALCPDAVVDCRWSGQVFEPVDGLPYYGETAKGQFVATGFAGNGMTFGTLGGYMARDWVLGLTNPWSDLFSVDRKKLSALWDYLKENSDYPYYLIKQRLTAPEATNVQEVAREQGKIVQLGGKKVAVYRDNTGKVITLSPVCPHMGCIVAWNRAEKTWDCPCHGSRFHCTGEVLAGPAETALATQQTE